MKVLALDFDGVLCDSAIECLINSYNSFNIIQETAIEKIYTLEKIGKEEVEMFLKLRPLVRVAKEYYTLWYLINRNKPIDPNTNIHKQARVPPHKLEKFNSVFYAQRKRWMDKDMTSWLAHNPFYKGVKQTLSKILDKENVIIVSSKDKFAIKAILGFNGLSINEAGIWGSESGMDKDALFRRLRQTYLMSFSSIAFLDDNLDNLLIAKDMWISTFFASWGYSTESEKKRVDEIGIPVITLEHFFDWAISII